MDPPGPTPITDSHDLLERLCNLPGVAGFEGPVREAIAEIVKPFVNEVLVDTLGNLIAVRRESSNFKLMLDAHMDEIGFGTCLLSDFDHTWRLLAAFCRAAPGV
ncbi:MAG TPA: hypothetical protein VJ386_12040 [Candidatus Deferrimicrobiaceae bacterium]|jgi:hypothetical protein|nr:MAG: hypothetical protein A2Z13_09410 [Deltaproteobacteria bacterium RBG_16_64_85]HJX16458.1 hypothetical protein [Candidatus Deferrimicrobiaceae bacterium]